MTTSVLSTGMQTDTYYSSLSLFQHSIQWARLFGVAVANGVTTPLVNLSETSDKKVAQTDQTGQTNQTMTTSPKQTKKESLTQSETVTMDGTENEKESEILEFDDCSEVDYDLDYTVQY